MWASVSWRCHSPTRGRGRKDVGIRAAWVHSEDHKTRIIRKITGDKNSASLHTSTSLFQIPLCLAPKEAGVNQGPSYEKSSVVRVTLGPQLSAPLP